MGKIASAMLLLLAFFSLAVAQDPLTAALAQYQHETDPVRKARELAKFGGDQVELAKKQLKSGDDVGSLHTLEQYRDEVRETVAALKAAGIDAEKRPAGFKELQISLRETVRRLDDLIFTLPVDKRPFFREVRTDLVTAQNDLIDALFPREPGQKSKKPNS
ncbi:MAG: hypothetical protein LAO08_03975 [Acidobacteriia bacterium]|nr:hypothetical protein [Terriglobia bacterium]